MGLGYPVKKKGKYFIVWNREVYVAVLKNDKHSWRVK